jgi:MtN3 and saliva related transmembrane protein
MAILSYLASFFGMLMSFASIPQAYLIFKRKSAKDVSILTYILFCVGSIVWVFYGLELNNTTIIYPYLIGTFTSAFVLVGWLLYRKKKK